MWDASVVLARYLCSAPALVTGRVVCELGAGAHAVPGLTAACLGARRVVLTDKAAVAAVLADAVQLQPTEVAARVVCCALPWGANLRKTLRSVGGVYGSKAENATADAFPLLVLVSDALSLSPALFEPLTKTLRDLAVVCPSGVQALIAYRERDGTESSFLEGLAASGWMLRDAASYEAAAATGSDGAAAPAVLAFVSSEAGLASPVRVVEATLTAPPP